MAKKKTNHMNVQHPAIMYKGVLDKATITSTEVTHKQDENASSLHCSSSKVDAQEAVKALWKGLSEENTKSPSVGKYGQWIVHVE